MLTCSPEIKEVSKAILAVQGKVSGVTRDAKADAGARKYKYATLEATIDAVREHCIAAGLVLLQAAHLDATAGTVSIETRLIHAESGQWVACVSACDVAKGDAQSVGSAQTYMRRYGLMALLALAPEDDDGQAARGAPTGQPPAAPDTKDLLTRLEALATERNAPLPKGYKDWPRETIIKQATHLKAHNDWLPIHR